MSLNNFKKTITSDAGVRFSSGNDGSLVGDLEINTSFVHDALIIEEEEKYYNEMIEGYRDMPNHDEIETKALQENIKKQIEDAVAPYKAFYDYFNELYGQGLEVANWHQNGDLEPFDEFFEDAKQEMKNEIMTIERKKEIADFANKACDRNDGALRKLSE